ncbi:T9SS type A sorting domain-containing protein [Flavobacterium sp.]|uniref:T9SS type A sorting domain-containing protein n=1 Tax=Flavobacterium sp. TaxID=239 RepID=UPI00286D4CDE|nr:T9SS type A sorting domain-containing protein [Flavobacterium sp.]
MKTKLILIALIGAFTTNAQNIFQDDFSSYTSGTQLSGQGSWTNNSSNGGLGSCIGALCTNAPVISTFSNYTDFGSSEYALQIIPNTDGVGRLFPAVTSGDLYVGFVLNISSAQVSAASNPNDIFRVMNGGAFTTTFRMNVVAVSGSTYSIGIKKGDSNNAYVTTAGTFNYNEDVLIILKYTQLPDVNDDELRLYVNPDYASGEPAVPTAISALPVAVGGDQSGNVDRMAFRQNWTTGMPSGKVSLVSMARTWEDLTFLPLATAQFNSNTISINGEHAKNGMLAIQSSMLEKATLKIFALNGALIEQKAIDLTTTTDVAIAPLNAAVYIVEITGNSGKRYIQKIIVN